MAQRPRVPIFNPALDDRLAQITSSLQEELQQVQEELVHQIQLQDRTFHTLVVEVEFLKFLTMMGMKQKRHIFLLWMLVLKQFRQQVWN